jgi:hypothetical protein
VKYTCGDAPFAISERRVIALGAPSGLANSPAQLGFVASAAIARAVAAWILAHVTLSSRATELALELPLVLEEPPTS